MSTLDTRSGLGNDVPLWKRYVAGHHWRNAEEEFDACTLGFWLFLATEVLLFAGCVNTGVLLISSYTMAASIRMFQLDRQSTGKLLLAITFICGIGFLFVKGTFEYLPKLSGWFFFLDPALPHYLDFKNGEALGGLFVHIDGYGGKAPGQFFSYAFSSDPWEPLWWSVYYCATGIHALHVVIGMSLIAWCWVRARKGAYGPTHYTMVENTGLYWHLVDLIWIFLFPLLYLIH